jgi:TetR/AcrR family transcriptional repressor of bet genes
MPSKKPGTNKALQLERRKLLMDATMSAISEHGLSRLTLAKIAGIAGLSAGSVNFHFDSKETLLLETLNFLAEEFGDSVDRALATAGDNPADQMLALLDASLDSNITEPRKMAVWFAFTAESRGRKDYQRICGAQDKKIFTLTLRLCDQIIRLGDKQKQMNARAMANAIQGLIDEIWEEILYTGEDYDRADARFLYRAFLASVFPWAFNTPTNPENQNTALSAGAHSLKITRASSTDAAVIARLFDKYRQFYQQPANPRLAKRFIGDNLQKERSVIFLARDIDDKALGFVQLYPGWCSVAAKPLYTLYDLFVSTEARQRGVGRELMLAAQNFARRQRACRIDLETAVDNFSAQNLYEDLGYERETSFYKYSLELS